MANEHVQRCSTSVDIRGGKLKLQDTTHYTPTRILTIKTSHSDYWQGCRAARTLTCCLLVRILNGTTTLAVSFKVKKTT